MSVKAFCYNKNKVKAFVLGADPTNKSDSGKRKELNTVFAIGSGEARYFDPMLKNLELLGLTLKDIYVQNLVQEYLEEETSKNPNWEKYAEKWCSITKKEFDDIDPNGKVPVFVTAERIFKFLFIEKAPSAKEIYNGSFPFLTEASFCRLQRPLIPLYRHYEYALDKPEWLAYRNRLIQLF